MAKKPNALKQWEGSAADKKADAAGARKMAAKKKAAKKKRKG